MRNKLFITFFSLMLFTAFTIAGGNLVSAKESDKAPPGTFVAVSDNVFQTVTGIILTTVDIQIVTERLCANFVTLLTSPLEGIVPVTRREQPVRAVNTGAGFNMCAFTIFNDTARDNGYLQTDFDLRC